MSRRQRQADLANFRTIVEDNFASVFPGAVMQLLEQWVDGKSLGTVMA